MALELPLKSLCSKQNVFLLIMIVTLFLDRFVFKIYTPQIIDSTLKKPLYNLLNTFTTDISNDAINSDFALTPPGTSVRYFTYKSLGYSAALKKRGMERAEDHEFKSKYIVTPLVYESDTVLRAPGIRNTKIISLHKVHKYNGWFVKKNYNQDFKKCPFSECEIDLKGKKTYKADLVVFICKGLIDPPRRPPGQLWAVLCYESGVHWNYPNYHIWKDAFNITISYRFDADLTFPYFLLAWRDKSLLLKDEDYVAIAKQKTKTAVWWVSNCKEDRLNFVLKMQEYIDVDIYGRCSNLKCPSPIACTRMLNTTYKFYLAFENSFCKDYTTEKLTKNFEQRVHVVPVLKGAVDYDNHFPSGTIVDGNKFKSAKELALYLKELGNDLSGYSKMLQEADKLTAIPREENFDWCQVCEHLHTRKSGFIQDIKVWSHNNTCKESEYYST